MGPPRGFGDVLLSIAHGDGVRPAYWKSTATIEVWPPRLVPVSPKAPLFRVVPVIGGLSPAMGTLCHADNTWLTGVSPVSRAERAGHDFETGTPAI